MDYMTDGIDTAEPSSTVETGQTEEVEITQAHDDDLADYLERYKSGEFDESDPTEKAKEVVKSDKPTPSTQEEDEEQPEETVTLTRRELEALHKSIEEKEKSRQQQKAFIDRRNAEVGQYRKELKALRDEKQRTLDDKFMESPSEALKDAQAIQAIDNDLQKLEHEEKLLTHVHEAFEVVSKNVDLEKVSVEDVRSTLEEDGFTAQQIAQFLENPYANARGETLIQLFKRAQERSRSYQLQEALNKIAPFTRQLMKENESLKAKGPRLLNEVDKALRKGPPITSANGNAGAPRSISNIDVTKLSDSELSDVMKSLK